MKNQFISFEIAKELKDLGFDEPCLATYYPNKHLDTKSYQGCKNSEVVIQYNQECTVPLYQQVIEWFREKHNIIIEVWYDETQKDGFPWLIEIYNNDICLSIDDKDFGSYFDNYNEAREFLIIKAIEEIKKHK